MSTSLETRPKNRTRPDAGLAPGNLIQRKCACGKTASSGGCEECKDKHARVQLYSAGRSFPDDKLISNPTSPSHSTSHRGLVHDFGRVRVAAPASQGVQTRLAVNQPGDPHEVEADRIAQQVTLGVGSGVNHHLALSPRTPGLQRSPADGNITGAGVSPVAAPEAAPPAETPQEEEASRGALIVEDDSQQLEPGQMRKSEFIDELQRVICAEADAELARVGRSTQGCPYIERWMAHYRNRSASHGEQALRRYAPEAAGVSNARDYIPIVAARVRQAVSVWATTGQVTGIPEGVSASPSGAGGSESTEGSSGSNAVRFKKQEGAAGETGEPDDIRGQLGSGNALDGVLRSRMESAFGQSFSGVRVHTDRTAADMSSGMNARAFTIGSDIAFASGEYRPGSLIGDALIAHELAHVVQQSGGGMPDRAAASGDGTYDAYEEDADLSAVGAVAGLWGHAKGLAVDFRRDAVPRLRSGLKLQRCSCKKSEEPAPPTGIIAAILPTLDCSSPSPVTVDELKKEGVPAGILGITGTNSIATSLSHVPEPFDWCSLKINSEPTLSLSKYLYTKEGTYDTGTETPSSGICKGKTLTQKTVVSKAVSDKVKEGEIEHCEDNKQAFALSYSRYLQAYHELTTSFCSEGSPTCEAEAKDRFKSRVGIEWDNRKKVSTCLFDKSGLRDSKGWHTASNTAAPIYAKDCKSVTYTLDVATLKNVGKTSTVDLIKGCGE
jgi:hypothetical protein